MFFTMKENMPWMIVDEWSFWRRDMAWRAAALGTCAAWTTGIAGLDKSWVEARYDLAYPSLSLDWDGSAQGGDGGPIARVVARGRFQDPARACRELIHAARLPVVESKADSGRIELRLSAPLRPGLGHTGWELTGEKPLDWSRF